MCSLNKVGGKFLHLAADPYRQSGTTTPALSIMNQILPQSCRDTQKIYLPLTLR